MKLSMKLILLSTVLMLFSISISTISLYRMTDINNKTQELSTNWLPSMKLASQLNLTFNGFRRFELVHILLSDPIEMKRYENIMDGLQVEFNKLLNEYHNHISEIDEGNIYVNVSEMVNETTNSMSSAMSALKDLNIQSENLNKLILSLKSV